MGLCDLLPPAPAVCDAPAQEGRMEFVDSSSSDEDDEDESADTQCVSAPRALACQMIVCESAASHPMRSCYALYALYLSCLRYT